LQRNLDCELSLSHRTSSHLEVGVLDVASGVDAPSLRISRSLGWRQPCSFFFLHSISRTVPNSASISASSRLFRLFRDAFGSFRKISPSLRQRMRKRDSQELRDVHFRNVYDIGRSSFNGPLSFHALAFGRSANGVTVMPKRRGRNICLAFFARSFSSGVDIAPIWVSLIDRIIANDGDRDYGIPSGSAVEFSKELASRNEWGMKSRGIVRLEKILNYDPDSRFGFYETRMRPGNIVDSILFSHLK